MSRDTVISTFGLGRLKIYDFSGNEDLPPNGADFSFVENKNLSPQSSNFEDTHIVNTEESRYVSTLGTPIWDSLVLKSGGIELRIDTCLMTVSQKRNIVKTSIPGRDGTIKEYVNDGDYAIDIKGVLVSPDKHSRPENDIRDLIDLCKGKKSIDVTSEYLLRFNIYEAVIEYYTFPQKEGFFNMQAFTLKMLSDEPFEFLI